MSWVNKDKERIIKEFVQNCAVLALTPMIVVKCIGIRRGRKIKTPDAIIAATAIVHNLTLVKSDNDFRNITGLQVEIH